MATVTDQMGRAVQVPATPRRIISLVPSITETLFDLGAGERVVGVTKFCVHPADRLGQVRKIGGTKKFNFDAIDGLEPDLLIGNKEENYEEGFDRLAKKYPVWMSDLDTLPGALDLLTRLGALLDAQTDAAELVAEITAGFDQLPVAAPPIPVAYLIWRKPYMAVARPTFIDDLMTRAGLVNVFGSRTDSRYPEVTEADLRDSGARALLLSSEPFPFKRVHVPELGAVVPTARVELVDGELFSWPGSRLRLAPAYLRSLRGRIEHPLGTPQGGAVA